MTPEDKVKDDSANDKPELIELEGRKAVIALVVFLGLIATAAVMVGILVNNKRVEKIKAAPVVLSSTRIVASKDLEAYTLLAKEHLIVLPGKDDTSDGGSNELLGRYLLTNVTLGLEIKPDMLAPVEAKPLLDNAVAVTIPATATSSLGGQLRVGDMVDLLLVPNNQSATTRSDQSKLHPFEKVLVLNLPIQKDPKADDKNPHEAGAITLALPQNRRDEFTSALPGAMVVITRRVSIK